jgi:hypothetical protein
MQRVRPYARNTKNRDHEGDSDDMYDETDDEYEDAYEDRSASGDDPDPLRGSR